MDLEQFSPYLNTVRIPLRLACITGSGWPTVISLWYQYQEGKFYCATPKTARVVSYLKRNSHCAFEIAADLPPYCGIRGQTVATIDETLGPTILNQLLVRYLGGTDNKLAQNLLKKKDSEVAIVLRPIRVFTWDFSNRMQEVLDSMRSSSEMVCP